MDALSQILANQEAILKALQVPAANHECLAKVLANQQTMIENQQQILAALKVPAANQDCLQKVLANQATILGNQERILNSN